LPGILAPNTLVLNNPYRSWYNGLQTQLTKRLSNGLAFNVAYTYSKSIDTSSNNVWNYQYDNPFNLNYQRGLSDFDRRNVFVASWLWSPKKKFTEHVANTLLANWTFSGIHMLQNGHPFTVYQGIDVALDGTGSRQHAQLIPGVPITRSWSDKADMIR